MKPLVVPVWLQLGTVGLTAFGHWRAGSGQRHGWLLAATVHGIWFVFALWTHQYLLWTGAIAYGAVAVRNWRHRCMALDQAWQAAAYDPGELDVIRRGG